MVIPLTMKKLLLLSFSFKEYGFEKQISRYELDDLIISRCGGDKATIQSYVNMLTTKNILGQVANERVFNINNKKIDSLALEMLFLYPEIENSLWVDWKKIKKRAKQKGEGKK